MHPRASAPTRFVIVTLSNMDISELLARLADKAEGHRGRAFRKASRAALYWEEEAASILEEGRAVTDLYRVGPKIGTRSYRSCSQYSSSF